MIPRTLLLIIPGLLLSVIAAGQNKKTDPLSNSDIYFLKNSGQVVKTKDSADYIRIISPPDSSDLNLFVVKDYYPNGKPKAIGKSLIPQFYLKRQGKFITYFPNGHRKSIESFDNGSITGDIFYYYPNGKLYYTATYDRAKGMQVVQIVRDSTGTILAENGNGTYIQYDDDFKSVTAKGPVVNGLNEGEWQGSIGDSAKYVCTFSQGIGGAGKSYDKAGKEHPFQKLGVEPQFKGGLDAFYMFIQRNLHYPKLAKENNVQGRVYLSFTIEKDGTLTNVHLVRGIGSGCDEESMRVLKLSPRWIPGYQYGLPVRVLYTLPLTFALQSEQR